MTLQKAEAKNKEKSRSRFKWIYRLMTDLNLHPNARILAVVIADHVNRESGFARPSQARLAELLDLTPKTIQNLLPSIVDRGYIEITPGVGRGVTHEYRIKDETDFAICTPEKEKPVSPNEREKAKPVSKKGEIRRTEKAKPVSVKPVIEPVIEPVEYISRDFDRFWETYPKRVARGAARKAFAKARKSATAEQIIAGAERYARQVQGKDPKFTKHPATWLNSECWEDEAPPPGRQLSFSAASVLQGAFAGLDTAGGEHDAD